MKFANTHTLIYSRYVKMYVMYHYSYTVLASAFSAIFMSISFWNLFRSTEFNEIIYVELRERNGNFPKMKCLNSPIIDLNKNRNYRRSRSAKMKLEPGPERLYY